MSATDAAAGAWRVSPADYVANRPVEHQLAPPSSCYVTMRDGCRIALDAYVPQPKDRAEIGRRYPTLVFLTPYYRRFKLRAGGSGEVNPNTGKFRDYFVPRGYVVVVVDVRGTGASFGTRDSFRSPRERDDSSEIADWIVAQPWSDGVIGATGISYLGAAADFLASTGHPAVKAIAPICGVWDTYADNYFPGGIQLKSLTKVYDELMVGLDHDRRDILRQFSYFANPDFEGPQPVDEDPDGVLVNEAVKQHLGNFRQTDFMAEFRFREEGLPYDPAFSSATISPYAVSEGIKPDVAILSISGWYDGAGYANGAIARHLTMTDNPRHLLLGPWDHGARIDISPWRQSVEPSFPLLGEVLRFFDTYLRADDTGLADEAPVHYYAVHAEAWRAAHQWPPVVAHKRFHLAAAGQLADAAPPAREDRYAVDFSRGTGHNTRYERIAGIDSRDYYADWQGRTEVMLSYTSAPLPGAMELAGHGLADLFLSSSEPDLALFVYLTEIEAGGTERYVTEGLLRALHRKETAAPVSYRATWPFRSFARADAAPLVPGQIERIRVPLLPVAWQFAKGSRIRLSIAGHDDDHCGQVPHGRPPVITLRWGEGFASALDLPLVAARH
ncbi:MAG TPA: CocE/NonD family hydrolase [Bradyrhizobium sp.]|nr:CocE/NonD family hydrolase [Bradyrhizobium sp.]